MIISRKSSAINNPVVEELLYTIRHPNTNSKDFRRALEEIGFCIGLEISNHLATYKESVRTSLDKIAQHSILRESPVIVPILRAGLPLYTGLLKAFPNSESGFIGAMRNEETLKPIRTYVALPNLERRTVILADTMIGTGGSLLDSIKLLKEKEAERIIIAGVLAAREGIERIKREEPSVDYIITAIDSKLNEKGYIVPGLGDAGDRCYGKKV